MASDFLKNLQNAVETGDFNSEAAKKINEIDEKAKTVENVQEKVMKAEAEYIPEEEALKSAEYEQEMEKIKIQDAVNKQLATLIEIEDMVKLSISDMISFANELKEKFGAEFEAKNPMFADLLSKINEINMRYNNSIINN
jgi:hypothetical protein